MEKILILMIGISICLAFITVLGLVWAIKNGYFSDSSGFIELNDSDESLQMAVILEQRKIQAKQKKALFLDRDGVINKDFSYVYELDRLEFMPNIFDICKFFYDKGYIIFIITNQSGINRGYYSKTQMDKFNNAIIKEFKKYDINISKIYFCPHAPEENCECRKPKPAMIFNAKNEFDINLSDSVFIGDNLSDMQAAFNAGILNRYLYANKFKSSEIEFKYIDNLLDIKKDF